MQKFISLDAILGFVPGLVSGILVSAYYIYSKQRAVGRAQITSTQILKAAHAEAEDQRREMIRRGKDDIHRRRGEFDLDQKRKSIEINRLEHKYQQRDQSLKLEENKLENLRHDLHGRERDLGKLADRLMIDDDRVKKTFSQLVTRLEQTSQMTQDEARRVLYDSLRNEVKLENQQWISKSIEDTKATAKEKSIDIICCAMQRHMADPVSQRSSSLVKLPSDDLKGRIIGKEGRNIKALEMATGMEFVIGDSVPDGILISGFNPIRREVARRALTKLIADGRINPTKIEDVVAECEAELSTTINEIGQATIVELSMPGMHQELVEMLGKLNFRTSYSQNVLSHCKEVGAFARMIAEEFGLDGKLAERCGLLHDIGKAVSAEVEGPHAKVGADIAKRCGENAIVVNAIAAHHQEVPYSSSYAVITHIADAISAMRPGARKETLSTYIKRLESLEEIATSFPGIKKAFALQAGREVRIFVDENTLDDDQAMILARDIARKVEAEMNFPGQIKVNVIREKRAIEYAKSCHRKV
jgi:ribonuclease Y